MRSSLKIPGNSVEMPFLKKRKLRKERNPGLLCGGCKLADPGFAGTIWLVSLIRKKITKNNQHP